jgi:hypothetical protein
MMTTKTIEQLKLSTRDVTKLKSLRNLVLQQSSADEMAVMVVVLLELLGSTTSSLDELHGTRLPLRRPLTHPVLLCVAMRRQHAVISLEHWERSGQGVLCTLWYLIIEPSRTTGTCS